MKILFTQDALVNAGAERSHLEILSRFSSDMEVGFVYFYPKHDLKEAYQDAGICLHFLDIPESYSFGTAISRLVRLIRKEKPDLLVSSLYRADIITRFAALITGVPLVGTLVNDSYGPFARKEKPGLKYQLVYLLDRWTAGIPIHWIANAQALVDSHVKTLGLKREKISVVYRGRVVPVIASEARQSQYTNQISKDETASSAVNFEIKPELLDIRLAVTPGSIRNFISYGRLLERKGFQEAILAFSEVVKQYPDCTLKIYGDGFFRKNLEDLVASLGLEKHVTLPGKFGGEVKMTEDGRPKTEVVGTSNPLIPNPQSLNFSSHNLLLKSDCFLFPSWYEGFSGSLVEAMMAGIPIIASDIPMNLEAVTADKNALIFPVKDVDALTQNMLYAIENPDRMSELGKAARLEAIERFDIEKIAREYEGVLLSMVCVPWSVSPQTIK